MNAFRHHSCSLLIALLLVPMTLGCPSGDAEGDGDSDANGGITPIYHWVVAFATEVGEWVLEKATTFGDAVQRAWVAFWGPEKVNNVIVNQEDSLKGTYDGILRCQVEWEKKERKNKLEIQLDHPAMERDSETSTEWELAPDEKKLIETMRDQLLRA